MIITTNSLTCLKLSLFLILLTIHVLGAFSSFGNNESVKCRNREKLALLKFKADLIDDFRELSTWRNDEKDCCKWKGVLCDNRINHVVALDLHGLGLRGQIGPSLLELANLNYLDLSFNYFPETQIPKFIGSLGKLQHLNLSFSGIGGLIPHSLGNLSMLRILDLSDNGFPDTNLDWLSSLQSLEHLDLSFCGIKVLNPHFLGNLSMLQILELSGNWVIDINFNWLAGLQSLKYLHLSNNDLHGSISNALGNVTHLFHLDLSGNYLEGRIPHAIGSLASLSHLDLSDNQIQGEFPYSIGNLTRLSYLDLSYNQLQGEVPDTVGNLLRLSYLALSNNELQGEFPRSSNQSNESHAQGNLRLPTLQVLDVSRNKFSGRVPELSSCSSLKWLNLYDNMFNGTLTESIGHLSNVQGLNLGSNHLEGLFFEAHLLNLSKLRVLDLSFNSNLTVRISSFWNPPFQLSSLTLARCKLGPHFPKWLQNQKEVEVVDLSNAKIFDSIPHWFWDNIQMCRDLNMSHNQIYGVLPDLSSKIHLRIIDLSSNEFNGSLPLPPRNINDMYLSRNKLSGTIINFCNFRNFFALDLFDNLFSSKISPDCFTCLMSLSYLNLANNNFSGEIPNSIDLCGLYSLH